MISKEKLKEVLAFHGLDADKDDDGKATEALKNALSADDVTDLTNRAEAGDDAREELANRDLEKYANRIGTDEKVKKFYRNGLLTNRDETIEVLEALPEKSATPAPKREEPVHNRRNAGNPKSVEGAGDDTKKDEIRASKIANRAREIRSQNPTIQNRAAFDQAESEIPAE